MGGIADYSGALVLQMPVAEACHAAVQVTHGSADPHISVVSLSADQASRAPSFTCPTCALYPEGQPLSYEEACTLFKVPEGKGVSSSAAVEVAVMQALLAACGQGQGQVPGRQLALLCQRVENLVVGAPCGIMDQMASALGEEGALLALLCQPAEVQGCVALPSHLSVQFSTWLEPSLPESMTGQQFLALHGAHVDPVTRVLPEVRYAVRQPAAHPVHEHHRVRLFRQLLQAAPSQEQGLLLGELMLQSHASYSACGLGSHGTDSQFSTWLEPSLPESMTGQQFLALHGAHVDPVTRVLPEVRYAVRQPAAHPVHEHHRVRLFRQLLQAAPSQEQGLLLGELMLQSHASYSACGLGSHGTDRLVEMVVEHISAARASGRMPLLFGAKITGGGSGGTVCILGSSGSEAEDAVQDIVSRYQRHLGLATPTKLFKGSSMGASTFGCLAVKLQ
ncbi:uncharacterized protein HaLaN_17428 [Haematococcus lacustris]|uniref:GHMP_kinases_N domain-containing protein n=1 Tax=Haematococcus lacustris TaxID=44745 RepID=A0A699ZEN1_HAELA|nr:uncharacterized protein HaLaN_17428 [Haematococcus lacustris]